MHEGQTAHSSVSMPSEWNDAPRHVINPRSSALYVSVWQKQSVCSLFGAFRAGQSLHSRPSDEYAFLMHLSHAVLGSFGWLPAEHCAHEGSSAERNVPGWQGMQPVRSSELVLPAAHGMQTPMVL